MSGTDVHVHLAPRLVGGHVPGVSAGDDGCLTVDGRRIGLADLYRPEALVGYLDTAGLDEAVVSLPPPFHRAQLRAEQAAEWAAAANGGLLAAIAGLPRLRPMAYLPLGQPEVALAEYRRIRTSDAWAGVGVGVGDTGQSLADPALDGLWRTLEADGTVVFVHPAGSPDPRLEPFYLDNLLGNPVETALAAAQLIFAGVPARFPDLRFLLAHCAGALPSVISRIRRGFLTARPGVPTDVEDPALACRRMWADSVTFDRAALDHALAVFGDDKLVLGSDWPFGMRPEDPRAVLAGLGEDLRQRIAERNARLLFG